MVSDWQRHSNARISMTGTYYIEILPRKDGFESEHPKVPDKTQFLAVLKSFGHEMLSNETFGNFTKIELHFIFERFGLFLDIYLVISKTHPDPNHWLLDFFDCNFFLTCHLSAAFQQTCTFLNGNSGVSTCVTFQIVLCCVVLSEESSSCKWPQDGAVQVWRDGTVPAVPPIRGRL